MIPGWNNYCKEKYRLTGEAFLTWLTYGKIRSGPIFVDMKATRKDFVQSLKFCKSIENLIRNNNLVNALRSKNMYQYGKEVKNQKKEVQTVSDTIDGNDNDGDIANVYYKKLSVISGTSGKADSSKNSSRRIVKDSNVRSSNLFSLSQIQEAIKQINTGIGLNGVHSNHLKFLPLQSVKFLFKFYNSCTIPKHFPAAMIKGKGQIKDKGGDLRSSENFREVMISNNIFKVFEYALLPLLKRRVILSSHQFAYRNSTLTIMAVDLLKETVGRYITEGSAVYACFLDMSKAFERVDHERLLKKLESRNVPSYLLDLLRVMFINSYVSVKYNDAMSRKWNLKRSVRQGEILSAFLFCAYMEDVLETVAKFGVGCKLE